MSIKNIRKPLMLTLCMLALPLMGCHDENTSGDSSEGPKINVDYSSAKAAIDSIQEAQNYTVATKIVENMNIGTADEPVYSKITTNFSNYFTPTYTWCDYEDAEEGYASKDGAVFHLNLYNDEIIASDAYVDESGNKLTSIYDIVVSPIPAASFVESADANAQTINISNKNARLAFIEFIQFDETFFADVQSFTASIGTSEDGEQALVLTMTGTDETVITSAFHSFGSTSVNEVAAYLNSEGSGAAVYDSTLVKAMDGFLGNNFTKLTYESLNYSEDNPVIGEEIYHSDYWYGGYYPDSGYSIYSLGYVSLPQKTYVDESEGLEVDLDGAYLFYLNETMTELRTIALAYPAFTTNVSDMAFIMDYPSNMVLWNHNLQFMQPYEDPSLGLDGEMFITYDYYMMYDFFEIAQVMNSLQAATTVMSCMLIDLIMVVNLDNAGNLDTVDFLFDILLNGSSVTLQYTYTDFGTTTIPALDEWMQTYIRDQQ